MYIYALRCPRSGEIRYIGKATNPDERFRQHLRIAKSGRKLHVSRWIRKLIRGGLSPVLEILCEVRAHEDWRVIERDRIAEAVRVGCRLTNIRAGGEGAAYLDPNGPQARERSSAIKAALARPEVKARLAIAMAEVLKRPEVKRKQSASAASRWKDDALRAKMGMTTLGARAKLAHSLSSYWTTNRELMLARMNTPARTAKISAAMKRRNADPKFRAIVDAPEVRKRQAATLKATWKRRKEQMACAE
jgi:hypothetical protein